MYCENLREIRCQLTKVIAVINRGPARCIEIYLLIDIFVIGEQKSVSYHIIISCYRRNSVACISSLMRTRSSATAEKQRVSCPHEGVARPSSPLSLRPLWLHLCIMVKSETRNKLTSSVPSTKHTVRWIWHSRSFKVILIGAVRNTERCVVIMCKSCRRYFWSLRRNGNGKTANSSISTIPLKFEDVPARNSFEYLQMVYINARY